MNLNEQLAEAEARVARIRQQIASGPCAEVGHQWVHIGGRNAGCGDDCMCSIPVHDCAKCPDCDYGENAEAERIMGACARRREAQP